MIRDHCRRPTAGWSGDGNRNLYGKIRRSHRLLGAVGITIGGEPARCGRVLIAPSCPRSVRSASESASGRFVPLHIRPHPAWCASSRQQRRCLPFWQSKMTPESPLMIVKRIHLPSATFACRAVMSWSTLIMALATAPCRDTSAPIWHGHRKSPRARPSEISRS